MDSDRRRFAPIGLVIAAVSFLAALGIYFVQREFNLAVQLSLALTAIGLATYALLDPDRVRQMLTGRQARYGSNALVLTVAFVGILVVVNYIVYQNPQRWDLTEDRQFTLTEETQAVLEELPQRVEAIGFYANIPTDQAETLLEQYAAESSQFTYRFVNPLEDPLLAERYQVSRDGSVVLVMGEQSEPVASVSEQQISAALVRLLNPEARVIYFLTGSGEYDIEEVGEDGYSQARGVLESKNYTVRSLNLLAENEIPEDASAIVIAGPQQPIAQAQVDLLAEFLDAGGGLIVMEEPLPLMNTSGGDPLASYLEEEWGIRLGEDMVMDLSSNQPLVAIGVQYGSHAITSGLEGLVVVMPTARSVTLVGEVEGVSQSILVSSSGRAWAETDLEAFEQEDAEIGPDEGVDIVGPVPLAVVAENFSSDGRLIVFGDADFSANAYFSGYANQDLLVNSVDWAAGQEELINLTPRQNTQRILIPPQAYAMNLIQLGTVILLPGMVLAAGVWAFIQRRRRS